MIESVLITSVVVALLGFVVLSMSTIDMWRRLDHTAGTLGPIIVLHSLIGAVWMSLTLSALLFRYVYGINADYWRWILAFIFIAAALQPWVAVIRVHRWWKRQEM